MNYLRPSHYLDFEDGVIQKLVSAYKAPSMSAKERAVGVYNHVRDGWKYDPYRISLSKENYRASVIAKKTTGNCVEKSILLVAFLRALAIPARIRLGKVKNHIAAERLIEKFGSDELTPHGMVDVYLNKKWLKASPAFNTSLCDRFNVAPLEFDGENSSFLQPYNSEGSLFMEYVEDYGYFDDVPLEFMAQNIKVHYPHIFDTNENRTEFKL